MIREHTLVCSLALLSIGVVGCSAPPGAPSMVPGGSVAATPSATEARGGRPASPGIVYVTSQGLYFDTFVATTRLPMQGRFQKLVNGATEFGPGDPGYLGGRWWVDVNGNDVQDEGDDFFLCPLLGPGRSAP